MLFSLKKTALRKKKKKRRALENIFK